MKDSSKNQGVNIQSIQNNEINEMSETNTKNNLVTAMSNKGLNIVPYDENSQKTLFSRSSSDFFAHNKEKQGILY